MAGFIIDWSAPGLFNSSLNRILGMDCLGIDFGRSSIKYGIVSVDHEINLCNFDAVPLPNSPCQEDYARALAIAVSLSRGYQAAGVGFPSLVKNNHVRDFSLKYSELWKRTSELLSAEGAQAVALNDADAAGIAEVYRPRAEAFRVGVTIVLTLGSGIGSAIFLDGKLLPNSEMGSFELHGMDAEKYAAASVKTNLGLSYANWAGRLNEYLSVLEFMLSPDHIVIGGGISADFEQFSAYLSTRAELSQAYYLNQAGVIGSAIYAAQNCSAAL
jgi:polyphosphate glucokinase